MDSSSVLHYAAPIPRNGHDISQEQQEPITECPKNDELDELSDRLQLLEMAFKEQVYARETIVREINDQSDIYGTLERKLTIFLGKLDNVTKEYAQLEFKYKELSERVNSDGNLNVITSIHRQIVTSCITDRIFS